jgi:hypothetical protein
MKELLKNLLHTNGTTNWRKGQEPLEYEGHSARPLTSRLAENVASFHSRDITSVHDNITDSKWNWHLIGISSDHYDSRYVSWVLYHDHPSRHVSLQEQQFLVNNQIPTIPQPLYSPNLALSNFSLFLTRKSGLKAHHFASSEEIQPYNSSSHIHPKKDRCLQEWQGCWSKCLCAERLYFDED